MSGETFAYPFPWTPPMQMPAALTELRKDPVVQVRLPSGDKAYLVTRYNDVRDLFSDARLSRNTARPGAARISKDNPLFSDPEIDPDPPAHTRVRGLVTRAFTARRVEALRPTAWQIASELLDDMEAGGPPGDVNEGLAFPLTIRVICSLLGVPAEDREAFRSCVDGFLSVTRFSPEEVARRRGELWSYLGQLIAAKTVKPGGDLISELIAVRDEDNNRLSSHELQFWIQGLLIAGYVTTASQIATSTAVLLHHPHLGADIRRDFSLVPSAVEELLRTQITGSSIGTLRYALEDIQVDGMTIPRDSTVLLCEESANHDESVFPEPRMVDITRTDNHHMTFGAGPHYCVGAQLARMELQVAMESLLRRFPSLRLAVAPEELRRSLGGFMEGFVEVPVRW
jgi:cytochrome P450